MEAIKGVISAVIGSLQSGEFSKRQRLSKEWPSIAGPKISPHTRPTISKQGEVCVWVDGSALAYELHQKYKASLLKRIQAVLGEEEVKGIRIRVGQLR